MIGLWRDPIRTWRRSSARLAKDARSEYRAGAPPRAWRKGRRGRARTARREWSRTRQACQMVGDTRGEERQGRGGDQQQNHQADDAIRHDAGHGLAGRQPLARRHPRPHRVAANGGRRSLIEELADKGEADDRTAARRAADRRPDQRPAPAGKQKLHAHRDKRRQGGKLVDRRQALEGRTDIDAMHEPGDEENGDGRLPGDGQPAAGHEVTLRFERSLHVTLCDAGRQASPTLPQKCQRGGRARGGTGGGESDGGVMSFIGRDPQCGGASRPNDVIAVKMRLRHHHVRAGDAAQQRPTGPDDAGADGPDERHEADTQPGNDAADAAPRAGPCRDRSRILSR